MLNRRRFTSLSGALFVSCACGGLHAATQPEGLRRKITIGARAARVIDFHAHCVIPEVEEAIQNTVLARPMRKLEMLGNAERRIAEMDKRGVDVQVLTIVNYWWYAADAELASRIVKIQDEGLAALCRSHPDRFVALSSPSLQHPVLAAQQLEYAVRQLGLKGASIGGHVNGIVPSGKAYDPFWAKAEELGVPVFMHPNKAENVTREHAWDGRGDLGNIIGNPLETTVFLSRLIFDGALDRFPKLKIVASHGGGYLPSYLARTDAACVVRKAADCLNKKPPRAYFKDQILADSLVFSAEGIRHLVAEMGSGQIVYGTDMPFVWPDTVDAILQQSGIDDAEKLGMLGGNAQKLLRLS